MFGTNSTHLGRQLRDVREDDELAMESTSSHTISVAAHADVWQLCGNCDWWDNALAFQVVPGNRPRSIGVVGLDCACTVSGGRDVLPSGLPMSGTAAAGRAPCRPQ